MGFFLDINKAAFRQHACLSITSDGQTLQIYVPSQAEVSQSQTDALIRLNPECSPATLTGRMGCGGLGGVDNFISQSSAGSTKRPSARCWLQEEKKKQA